MNRIVNDIVLEDDQHWASVENGSGYICNCNEPESHREEKTQMTTPRPTNIVPDKSVCYCPLGKAHHESADWPWHDKPIYIKPGSDPKPEVRSEAQIESVLKILYIEASMAEHAPDLDDEKQAAEYAQQSVRKALEKIVTILDSRLGKLTERRRDHAR